MYKYFEKLSKRKILEAIKMRDEIKPLQLNSVEDIMKEIEENGAFSVAKKYNITEDALLSYPYFKKYNNRWKKNNKDKVGFVATEEQKQKPVFELF